MSTCIVVMTNVAPYGTPTVEDVRLRLARPGGNGYRSTSIKCHEHRQYSTRVATSIGLSDSLLYLG